MVQGQRKKKQLKHSPRLKTQWVWFSLKKFENELHQQFPFLKRKPNYFAIFLVLIGFSLYLQLVTINFQNSKGIKGDLAQAIFNQTNPLSIKAVSASENEIPPAPKITGPINKIVPVLMYHYIQKPTANDALTLDLTVLPENLEKQLTYLVENGFKTISPQELLDSLEGRLELPQKPIILTFDDGYRDFYTDAYPIIKKLHLKATNFIPTGLLDRLWYLHTEDISELLKDPNITFAGHTVNHADLPSLPIERAQQEITQGKKELETLTGKKVDFFAYPYGAFDSRVESLVGNAGYKMAFTTKYGKEESSTTFLTQPRVRVSGNDSLEAFISKVN